MSKEIVKKYTNGEITIVWKPGMCIHSEKCFHGLPAVFNPQQRPWVNAEAADTETLKNQIDHCPSGALSYFLNDSEEAEKTPAQEICKVVVAPNGPLLVHGDLTVVDATGGETSRSKMTAFCRCGASLNKPFCDGSHKKIDFEG